jgi:hypothetical protein
MRAGFKSSAGPGGSGDLYVAVPRIHHADLFTLPTRTDRKIAYFTQKIGSTAPTHPLGYLSRRRAKNPGRRQSLGCGARNSLVFSDSALRLKRYKPLIIGAHCVMQDFECNLTCGVRHRRVPIRDRLLK